MDLVSAITGLSQAKALSAVQVSVAAKMLDLQKLGGKAAIQLLQAATNGVNQAGDALVAAATGLGGQVDTYA